MQLSSILSQPFPITHDSDLAQEAVQMAICDVTSVDTVPHDLRRYFLRSVRNRAYDLVARRKTEQRHRVSVDPVQWATINDTVGDSEHDAAAILLGKEASALLYWQLDLLDQKYREALCLHYFHGLSIKEIAKELKIAEGTVKSRMDTGKKLLKITLAPFFPENTDEATTQPQGGKRYRLEPGPIPMPVARRPGEAGGPGH